MTSDELVAFEKGIAGEFEAGHIHAPVHLHGGNEDQLIEIFKDIKPDDWVFSTHRAHYHALLKGIPPELVKKEIMAGHSISLQFPDYHFFTSAIVGGIIPIALGVAMSGQKVWCFVGDMSAETGIFHECCKYAEGNELPITFIIEDNHLSVETNTFDVWGASTLQYQNVKWYKYTRTYPHQGSGVYVIF